ncbi:MAG: histidinol-phosphate transaminase [Armatimonadota bacterium]|nr:histidinol-phosphate transaminase [Armatimonadota bacterium]
MAEADELIRETVKRIVPYSPGKSSAEVMAELGIERVTKLASNENPLGPSPLAVQAMQDAASEVLSYPDPQCVELTEALAEMLDVDPDTIVVGRGSDEILHYLGLAFVDPGDNLVFSDPAFAIYPYTARLMAAEEVVVPARDFRHDLDAMAEAVTERTKLVFISNPYNPLGTIVTADEVAAFMDRVPDTCIVVFDEAYFEYVDDPAYPDTLQHVREGARCAVLRTFSKAFALAGLRIGYGIAPVDIASALKQVREPFNVASVAQTAALASLRDPDQVPRSVANNRAGKQYLYGQFDKMGLEYIPTQANFIFVEVGMDSVACFDALMRHGVTVRTGEIFGFPEWIRVTIGTPEQNETFIAALRQVLAERPEQ